MQDTKRNNKTNINDFLSVLKLQLMDRLTPDELDEQMEMYENYIDEQVAGGKTLEQVMRKLGDPEKVADMIVEHYAERKPKKTESKAKAERLFHSMTTNEINDQIQNPDHGIHAEFRENEGWDIRLGKLKLNTWYGTLIILGIVLVIFVLISELLRK